MRVELKGLEKVKKSLKKLAAEYPAITQNETEKAFRLIVSRMESATIQKTPVGVGGAAGLRGSIFGETRGTPEGVKGLWGTPLKYGEVVELGRAPGTFPPHAPLELWCRRKLGIPEGESAGVARAIQWKIYKKGTEGAYMFEEAWDENEAWTMSLIGTLPDTIVKRLEGIGK